MTSESSHGALVKILGHLPELNRRDRRFLMHSLADREYQDDRIEELEERRDALRKRKGDKSM